MASHEAAAIAACRQFVEAQQEYIQADRDGDGVREYARNLAGLFETRAGAGDLKLIEQDLAYAEGLRGCAEPFHGYVFKVLVAQGAHAKGGALDYLTAGASGESNLTQGFALAACPSNYDGTGRNTFIVNQAGVVFQCDLGGETASLFEELTVFDPGKGWVIAD